MEAPKDTKKPSKKKNINKTGFSVHLGKIKADERGMVQIGG